jgi:hypothetical protein
VPLVRWATLPWSCEEPHSGFRRRWHYWSWREERFPLFRVVLGRGHLCCRHTASIIARPAETGRIVLPVDFISEYTRRALRHSEFYMGAPTPPSLRQNSI